MGVEWVGRGYAKSNQHLNREPDDFTVAVAEVFAFREDWHQDDRAKPLVRQYQVALDAVLRKRPDLQDCAVRCCHCGIRFFTHPRNAGRLDLRCEFGCRQHHRRQQANARSRKYYQRPEGRRNKKLLNGRRSRSVSDVKSTSADEVDTTPSSTGQPTLKAPSGATKASSCSCVDSTSVFLPQGIEKRAAPSARTTLSLGGVLLDESTLVNSPVLPYALMVASVLERRTISRDELITALRKRMRQRSIGFEPRREYVLRYLNRHPP